MKLTDISNNKAKEIIEGAPKEATHFSCIEGKTQYYKNETVISSLDEVFINVFRDIFQPSVFLLSDLENQMNIDKVETQSEHQEAMSALSGEIEWNGEGLPPVGAIYTVDPNHDVELLCKYSSKYVVVGEMLSKETYKGMEVVIDTMEQRNRVFRKPETPQQREDRERLEAAYDLYCHALDKKTTFDSFCNFGPLKDIYIKIVDKTNYRKGVK